MRIQETDRILKESRAARHSSTLHQSHEGMLSRVWKSVSSLPGRITGMFRHS